MTILKIDSSITGELADDRAGQAARDAVVTIDAAVDVKDGHRLVLGIDLLPGHCK